MYGRDINRQVPAVTTRPLPIVRGGGGGLAASVLRGRRFRDAVI